MALPRDYYTIEQAAIILTETFGEKVSAGDVQLFIETGRIIPAFRLNRVYAICGTILINYVPGKMKYEDVRPLSFGGKIPIEGMYSPFNIHLIFDTSGQLDICRKGYIIPALYEIYDSEHPPMIATETPTYQVVETCEISAKDMLITKRELLRFEMSHTTIATATNKVSIKKTRHKGDNTVPITKVINDFLDENYPNHNMPIFYEYVKQQLARKTTGKKDNKSTFPVKKVGINLQKGLFMDEPKIGKDGLSEADFWYSHKDICERLARAKKDRNIKK